MCLNSPVHGRHDLSEPGVRERGRKERSVSANEDWEPPSQVFSCSSASAVILMHKSKHSALNRELQFFPGKAP